MLNKRIKDTEERIESYRTKKEQAADYQNQVKNRTDLISETRKAIKLLNCYVKCQQLTSFTDDKELKTELVDFIESLADLNNGDTVDLGNITEMKDWYGDLLKQINEQWKAYFNPQKKKAFAFLDLAKTFAPDQVKRLRTALEKGNNFPLETDEFSKILKALNETEQISRSIGSEEVQKFLKKINKDKATISDLNEEIMNWIKENQLENRLKISFQ